CGVAAWVAARRGAGATAKLLEAAVGRRPQGTGTTDRSHVSAGPQLSWCSPAYHLQRESDGRTQRLEPARRCDSVHELIGCFAGAALSLLRIDRYCDRQSDCEPRAARDGKADRFFREHARAANESRRGAIIP